MSSLPVQRQLPNFDIAYRGALSRRLPGMPALGTLADLLDERPDIKAAAVRLQAANANIRISVAERFPSLTLNGTYLTLLDACRAQDTAEMAFLAVERNRWLTRVDVMLALGGQWIPPAPKDGATQ